MGKFSLQLAVGAGKQEKRPLEAAQQEPRKKGFRASDVVIEEDGPKPKQTTLGGKKFASNAPIQVIVFRYSDCATDVWQTLQPEGEQPLFQVQIKQDVARSVVLYQFREKFGEFIREAHGHTLLDFADKHGIRLVIGDANDPARCLGGTLSSAGWSLVPTL